MARRRSRYAHREPAELDITSFLNLMVVLVPFLLITAVFSRITVLQLNLPAGAGAEQADDKEISIEVIVRSDRIDIGDGQQIVTRVLNTPGGEYDFAALSKILLEIKRNFPAKLDATVLMEPDLEYEILVSTMDAVTMTDYVQPDGSVDRIELFPQISVGDAPQSAPTTPAATPAAPPTTAINLFIAERTA